MCIAEQILQSLDVKCDLVVSEQVSSIERRY